MKIRKTPSISFQLPFDLSGDHVEAYVKKINDLDASYEGEIPDILADKIAYRIASLPAPTPTYEGSLNFGITYLYPYTINGEYSMTRGHFHQNRSFDEYYVGISGIGYLLYWDGQDEVFVENVYPGSVHYINGKYAHRLINIDAKETLAVGACWNTLAGHDYETINRLGFPVRCFELHQKPVWINSTK